MIKKIKLPKESPREYCGNCPLAEQDGVLNAVGMVYDHIRDLRIVYAGQYEKIAVLDRLWARISEDIK